MKLSTLIASVVLVGVAAAASAQSLVVDRGLPTANLNDAAGSNRSNVAWGWYGNNWFAGDNFSLGTADGSNHWEINHIRTWVIIGYGYGDPNTSAFLGAANTDVPSDEFSAVNLYLGDANGTMSIVKSANLTGGTATDDVNVTLTPVTYSDGTTYQGNSTSFINMYQVDFTGLNITAGSGQSVEFGVDGVAKAYNNGYFGWFNHASNAALSGSTQQGADNLMQYYGVAGDYEGPDDSNGNGWDKSSDLNVQVWATQAVPEPSEFGFLAIAGLGLLSAAKRKIKRS